MLYHQIDIAVVNSYILFKEHQAKNPDDETLQRPRYYSLNSFRKEIMRQLWDFEDYEKGPSGSNLKSRPPPQADFETLHIPEFFKIRAQCVVCYKLRQGDKLVQSYCSAPQCKGRYMHNIKGKKCFRVFHSREYRSQYPVT